MQAWFVGDKILSEDDNGDGDEHEHVIETIATWKLELKKGIKDINEAKINDRLDVSYELFHLYFLLAKSVNGWMGWLQNPAVIKEFSKEQLTEYFETAKKNIVELLELDYKATDKYDEAIKSAEKKIGGIENSHGPQQRYTA